MANKSHLRLLKQSVGAWNTWRIRNPGTRPDLKGANLKRAHLSNADLTEAYLVEANFAGANLAQANFAEANLNSADLRDANARGVILTKANLQRANLTGTIFSEALLDEANLTEARFAGTMLGNVDLSNARGLETCSHLRPSTVNHRTIVVSGTLPLAFLRGCGLSNWEIESAKLYDPSLSSDQVAQIFDSLREFRSQEATEYYSCFISYSRADEDFATRLHDALQEKGVRCWLDKTHIRPGDDVLDQIGMAINLWDKVALCCSESSLNSVWVEREIEKALQKEERLTMIRKRKVLAIIPLNLDGYLFAWNNGKASILTGRSAPDFTNWECDAGKFQMQVERIVEALRVDAPARLLPPQPKL